MNVPLSPRAFRLVDGGSKLVGLVAIAAALNGAAAPHSLAVGLAGFVVGVGTAFLSPREAPSDADRGDDSAFASATDTDADDGLPRRPLTSLATRLWRSRLARLGGALWLSAFGVAAAGVALRAAGSYRLAATLFGASGPLGLVGILGIAAGGGWLALASRRE
ncbi:hypothetical protein [Haloferax sulfurifontis]|uniref:DUF8120 domain-containing protein n=1 Tax=Haloferax sulfurifontis ATCC BAA-897 TaxID=662480 RepID=M0I2N4_9EURY|nr:hypothetical protein [Haloferax sulfurifontis]ELZ91030.1 hypothetical protein C441_11885 [Haloferax sulfurifontis ATCC BAA-897]